MTHEVPLCFLFFISLESGVGAGIDSYYEYVLKAYVLLGDDTYLARFNKVWKGGGGKSGVD